MLANRVRMGSGGKKELLFYDRGNEFKDITGGWTNGYSLNNGQLLKNIDHLFISALAPNTSVRTYVTDISIDLTNINQLKIDWENSGTSENILINSYFIVADIKTSHNNNYVKRIIKEGKFSRREDILDVSDLNGNYFIRVHAQRQFGTNEYSEVKVYKIWGEG